MKSPGDDSLHHNLEKDQSGDFQHLRIERQVQLRQGAWNERLDQVRQELEAQHAKNEAERVELIQQHQQKSQFGGSRRAQVAQASRQAADAQLAAEEKTPGASN